MTYHKENEKDGLQSPLNLFYSAWADQQPTVNQRVTEQYVNLDKLLSSLPEPQQHCVYRSIGLVVAEQERTAFLEGLRMGAQLAAEVVR